MLLSRDYKNGTYNAVVVLGATATGKTAYAVKLAE